MSRVVEDADLTPAQRARAEAFLATIVDVLAKYRVTPQWRSYVAVYIAAGLPPRVVARDKLAQELRKDDLSTLANEVIKRKVKPNEVLILVVTDTVTRCWPMRLEAVVGGPDYTFVPADAAIAELLMGTP